MKSYAPPMKRPRKALQLRVFSGVKCSRPTPVFPHIATLFFTPCGSGASLGAIPCAAIREKGPAADRARPGFRDGTIGEQGGLQRRIGRQNSLPEVAAQCPCPAFPQHKALTVQRQAAVVLIIVGAQGFYQLVDRPLFFTGQLTGQSVTPCPLRRPATPGNRSHSRCPASRGSHGRRSQPEPWACLLYTSPSPRDLSTSRMPSSA